MVLLLLRPGSRGVQPVHGFPAARNRILGWQLFKYGFEGFHQGYNHWYKVLTGDLLDLTPCLTGQIPSARRRFCYYPGKRAC